MSAGKLHGLMAEFENPQASERRNAVLAELQKKNPEEESPNPEGLFARGTAGRILKMLKYPDGSVRILVLDESDRMLDMGFLPAIQRIVSACRTAGVPRVAGHVRSDERQFVEARVGRGGHDRDSHGRN